MYPVWSPAQCHCYPSDCLRSLLIRPSTLPFVHSYLSLWPWTWDSAAFPSCSASAHLPPTHTHWHSVHAPYQLSRWSPWGGNRCWACAGRSRRHMARAASSPFPKTHEFGVTKISFVHHGFHKYMFSTLMIIRNASWAPSQHIRMISEGSCDTFKINKIRKLLF